MHRYFPSTDSDLHYTAVTTKNNKILQVKSPSDNTLHWFDTLELWLQSLPPNGELRTESKEDTRRVKAENFVPYGNWTEAMMKHIKLYKPSALNDENVMNGFNRFVASLKAAGGKFQYHRYHHKRATPFCSNTWYNQPSVSTHISGRLNPTDPMDKEIIESFNDLYKLIGKEVHDIHRQVLDLSHKTQKLRRLERNVRKHQQLVDWYQQLSTNLKSEIAYIQTLIHTDE